MVRFSVIVVRNAAGHFMRNYLIISVLLIYYLFTSGFIFEVTKSEVTDRVDIPFNYALSAERTGIVMVATQDDMNCMDWLNVNWDKKLPIIGDYNSYCLIQGNIPAYFFLTNNLRKGDLTHIPDDCYIFVSSWNGEHGKFIEPTGIGVRKPFDLPQFKQPIAYQSGSAKVYLKQAPKPGG
jgi:hypothetical protein